MEQLVIKYAYPLDQERRLLFENKKLGNYPSMEKVEEYTEKFKEWWRGLNKDNRVLDILGDITKTDLPYTIEAYVIGGGFSSAMSVPFLLPIIGHKDEFHDQEWFVDTIIHELIHLYLGEDKSNFWDYFRKKYASEIVKTKSHIMVYAIMKEVFKRLNIPESFNLDSLKEFPAYHRALEIVEEEGYEKLISEFQSFYTNS